MQLQWEFIEAKLREMGYTDETVAAAARAYEAEREAESRSHLNQDLLSTKQSRAGGAADGADMMGNVTIGADGQVREMTAEEKRSIKEKMKWLKLEGRLLPDSAMTTYFGKPAFHTYGNGNVRPASGGLVYGQYLKTHNINPHSGDNKPEHAQVYGRAMVNPKVVIRGSSKSPNKRNSSMKGMDAPGPIPQIVRRPQPPRVPELKRPLTGKQLDELQKRLAVEPEKFAAQTMHIAI